MKDRTKTLAVEIIKFARSLPTDPACSHIARQLIRCGTSIGANYRASCRAKSKPDFISKMGTVEEEADETLYWFEMLLEADIVARKSVAALLDETEQVLRIVVASINTTRGNTR